ncbi:hypothetical protein EAO28_24235 [Klebsiella pneumoniae]|uniref:Uncharacterized protein n=1 Tax=Klebsiella pneumoniae TaxID=573 RepID=A0A3P2EHU6_KLEPN|nr:hypothetical protein DMQ18_26055 [Klebsiella pneumoniae]RRE44018.1 hypothetical protein EAO28_24235 [Klebsiella pneumoniae]
MNHPTLWGQSTALAGPTKGMNPPPNHVGRIRREPPSGTNTGTRPDCPAALRLPGLRKGRTRCQIT